MSVTSGFFNSLDGDRKYNAEQMSSIFDGIITDGVFMNIGTAFEVKADSGNNITVGIGRAWINHGWIYNDAILPIVLEESEILLNRYDAIVLEMNHEISIREGSVKVIKGTPSSNPQFPVMINTTEVIQFPLAYILRTAGSTKISQADITNKVGSSECPYITGILQTIDNDNIVAQWQNEFDVWFENVKDVLSGDVAGNLEIQIEKLKESKAEKSDIVDDPDELLLVKEEGFIAGAKAVAQLNANYIVEENRNSNGYYRKWNNGTLEMWGSQSVTRATVNQGAGGVYHSDNYTFSLPYTSLTNVSGVSLLFRSNAGVWAAQSTGGDLKKTLGYWVFGGANTTVSGSLNFRCTGTWK